MLILLVFMAGIFLPPFAHWAVRRMKFWGVRSIIAGLVFAPGLCVTTWLVLFYISFVDDLSRWTLVYVLQGRGALSCLAVISGITATYLGVCLLLEHFSRRKGGDEEDGAIRVVEAWRSLVAIQLALIVTAAYLYSYTRLEDAVSGDNLALAEKRLGWNLEGLGPNNGLIVLRGTAGLARYPLLPVAVKNGNFDMVKLLVKHGADLNPKDWDESTTLGSGQYVKSSLYFAVIDRDVKMIDFLIDLGVKPEQGIYPALWEDNRELLGFFLEKGASLEFALGVAKEWGWNQQQIDQLFADYIPKSAVETGQ